jgi:hypothetical protein
MPHLFVQVQHDRPLWMIDLDFQAVEHGFYGQVPTMSRASVV